MHSRRGDGQPPGDADKSSREEEGAHARGRLTASSRDGHWGTRQGGGNGHAHNTRALLSAVWQDSRPRWLAITPGSRAVGGGGGGGSLGGGGDDADELGHELGLRRVVDGVGGAVKLTHRAAGQPRLGREQPPRGGGHFGLQHTRPASARPSSGRPPASASLCLLAARSGGPATAARGLCVQRGAPSCRRCRPRPPTRTRCLARPPPTHARGRRAPCWIVRPRPPPRRRRRAPARAPGER